MARAPAVRPELWRLAEEAGADAAALLREWDGASDDHQRDWFNTWFEVLALAGYTERQAFVRAAPTARRELIRRGAEHVAFGAALPAAEQPRWRRLDLAGRREWKELTEALVELPAAERAAWPQLSWPLRRQAVHRCRFGAALPLVLRARWERMPSVEQQSWAETLAFERMLGCRPPELSARLGGPPLPPFDGPLDLGLAAVAAGGTSRSPSCATFRWRESPSRRLQRFDAASGMRRGRSRGCSGHGSMRCCLRRVGTSPRGRVAGGGAASAVASDGAVALRCEPRRRRPCCMGASRPRGQKGGAPSPASVLSSPLMKPCSSTLRMSGGGEALPPAGAPRARWSRRRWRRGGDSDGRLGGRCRR